MGWPGIIGAFIGLLGVYMYYMKPPVDQKTGEPIPERRKNQNATIFIVLGLILFAYARIIKEPAFEKEHLARREKEKADSLAKVKEDKPLYAYINARNFIKDNLKDADSYDEIDSKYYWVKKEKDGTEIEVIIKYKAKNSFNAFITETKYFHFTKDLVPVDSF